MIINFIRGFCMALADSVPGVSGGTIAFLLGFYDRFIGSLNALIGGTREEKIEGIKFLAKIAVGWVIGFCMAILFITSIFDSHIYEISSLFMGFILFALPVIVMEEQECLKGKYKNLLFAVIGAAVVCAITYFSAHALSGNGINLAVGKFSVVTGVYLFLSGMIAIAAMVLPGISGSTIIMIFGLYVPITTAIKDVLHLKLQYVPALVLFGLGVILGALLVVKIIRKALESYRSQMVCFILGMMLGSLYSIVQGPATLDEPRAPMSLQTFRIAFFAIGGIIILGLQKLKSMIEK